ncbi:hypothetical protein [Verrucomicrobium spinosum]|uniref:GspE/PulE/PilB domain-containing protein n=1 Tax=Verrucomicrobium spinosum TaxID=2736 RepID=UPI000AF714B4|nr:hypothetical protein [Verrucomicrobium spinosum]
MSFSLTDLLAQTASEAGCTQSQLCRQTLEEAVSRRGSLVEALLDANLVDEDLFIEHLGRSLSLPFTSDESLEPADNLHNRFPAKLALRHRVYPAHLSGADLTLLTYDPFNLDARQAVGQEVRKRITWGLPPVGAFWKPCTRATAWGRRISKNCWKVAMATPARMT